ncbi:hypothetical protein KM043_002674 [Ampulex compressa]|nr:hypothetical protein KM043_002674 [Ampulex compressa]
MMPKCHSCQAHDNAPPRGRGSVDGGRNDEPRLGSGRREDRFRGRINKLSHFDNEATRGAPASGPDPNPPYAKAACLGAKAGRLEAGQEAGTPRAFAPSEFLATDFELSEGAMPG